MRQRRHLLMFALALLCLSFAACGAKQYPMQITVVNRSTYPITDLASVLSRRRTGAKTAWRPRWRKAKALGSTWASTRKNS